MQQAKARTEERRGKRKAFLAQLSEQLKAAEEKTAELDTEHTQLHERRAQEHLKREEEVRQKFKAELESLKGALKAEGEEKEKEKKKQDAANAQAATDNGSQSSAVALALAPSATTDPAPALQAAQARFQQQI